MTETTLPERLALSGQDRDCTVLTVGGMTSGACANAVQSALARVPGVVSAEVDLAARRAKILGSAPPHDLVTAVEGAGFDAVLARDARPTAGGEAGGYGERGEQ